MKIIFGDKMTRTIILILIIGLLAIWSCDNNSTGNNNNETEMEGTWIGYELDGGNDVWTYDVNEDILNISASPSEEWYNGVITLNTDLFPKQVDYEVTGSSYDQAVGLTTLGIYKIEGDTLTLAANAPGISERPQNYLPTNGTRVYIVVFQ